MTERAETRLLSAADIVSLLDISECIDAVESGFLALGENKIPPPQILALHAKNGGLHIKAAVWKDKKEYFVAKANANFPDNPKANGLPTIQGVIILCDALTGELLALMDSIEITAQRTAAATAVAARRLARADSSILTICGCGRQGLTHLRTLMQVLPIHTVHAFDIDEAAKVQFVKDAGELRLEVSAVDEVRVAIRESDVIVTCTPSQQPFIMAEDIRPGAFIAAVGTDSEHKQEIDVQVFPISKVVVDSLSQCAKIGDLHHAIQAGLVTEACVHAELAEIVSGQKPGRTSQDEITLFDSTGVAIEDAATAAYVYEKAAESQLGRTFRF